jgi:hypothetical protein
MIYADLPAGGSVLLDASVFIHHFEPKQTGVLHNDALIVAAMRAHGLSNLASADSDFDRVAGITRYGPS